MSSQKISSPAFLLAVLCVSICALVYVIVGSGNPGQNGGVSTLTSARSQLAQVVGPTGNLLVDWNLDEGSGITSADSNGSGLSLNLNNASWTTGAVGSGALTFSGAAGSYAQTSGSINLPAGDMTISFWLKAPTTVNQSTGLISVGDLVFCALGRVTTNSVSCTVDGSSGNVGTAAYTTSPVNDNAWHLITFTNTSGTQRIYFDGTQQTTASRTMSSVNNAVSIGAFLYGNNPSNVSLDDVRVYSRSLSAGEVGQLFALKGSSGGGATTYSLSLTNSNASGGSVTSNPAGISCGPTCSVSNIAANTTYTLTASPNANFTTSWSGCTSSNVNSCTVNIGSANASVSVNFTSSGGGATPPNGSYSTSFNTVENPLSEGGIWLDGKTAGLDWSDVAVANVAGVGNVAEARQNNGGGPSYNDATAILTGTWQPDQTVTATLYKGAVDANQYPEVELRLRSTMTAHSSTGYEVMYSLRSDSTAYVAIARWNGPFANPTNSNNGFAALGSVTGSQYIANNGATLKATIIGSTITAYLNNTPVLTVTDSTYSTGNPGLGLDHNGGSANDATFGLTSYSATSASGGGQSAPTISGVSASSITQTTATIGWTTNITADSQVEFGTNLSYGNSNALNSTAVTSHNMTLSGLVANTVYHYRVHSGTSVSGDFTFTTAAVVSGGPQTCEAAAGSNCWYIDNNATGANNGTSWANAWTSFDRQSPLGLAGWSMIKPGDYIYISGGSTGSSQTYSGMIEPGVSGTALKPITIRVGQDAGHNGKVIVDGGYRNDSTGWYGISIADQSYITITGQVGSDQTPHMEITHHYDDGIYVIRASYAIHLSYMEVDTNGFDPWVDKHLKSTQPAFDPDAEGIFFSVNQRNDILGEVDHMIVHGNNGDAARFTEFNGDSTNVSNFGLLKIHDNDFYDFRADCVKISLGGVDFYNNHEHDRGIHVFDHPDGIQFWSSYVRIFNNTFNNFDNSAYILPGYDDLSGSNSYMRYNPGEGGDADHNPRYVYIYNNLFYEPSPRVLTTGNVNRGIELSFHSLADTAVATVSHIYVANNVFSGVAFFTIGLSMHRDIPTPVSDLQIVNNVFNNSGPMSLDPGYLRANTFGGIGSGASVIIDKNDWYYTDPTKYNGAFLTEEGAPGNPASSLTTFFSYNNFKALFPNSAYPGFLTPGVQSHDVVTDPKIDVAGLSFVTLTGSPLLDAGTNSVSNAFTTDRNGVSRPQGSAWDIGPFEGAGTATPPPSNGPVLQLNFEGDNFGTGIFSDKSGTGNNGNCQTGFVLNGVANNQCPTTVTGPDNSTAAKFVGGLCNMASDYIDVPTSASLTNLTSGSMSFWAAFNDNTLPNLSEMVLDTLSGSTPNTWELGRQGTSYLTFTANTDTNALLDFFTFPGSNEPLGSWNHYTITWDGTTVKGYYNGKFFGQTSQQGVSSLKLGTYLAIGALNHGDPRNTPDNNCVTYYGADPSKSYVQPNGDFLNGNLDDVRIYNRALSATEVSTIASAATVPSTSKLLTVTKTGTGVGYVGGNDLEIDCGKHCAEAYVSNNTVTLTATPQDGTTFTGWGGACSGTGTCVVTMNADKAVTATFTRSYPIVATFAASSGTIAAPFVSSGGTVSQNILSTTPSLGGRAAYTFTVPAAGNYIISGTVDAPRDSSNSFFVNVDAEPDSTMYWNMTTTAGFQESNVSWGGFSSGGNPSHAFALTAGTHTLIIRGREAGTVLSSINVMQVGGTVTTADPSLVLHLDFNSDWSSTHTAVDTSGTGNNANCQTSFTVQGTAAYGLSPQTVNANQCPAKTTGPTAGSSAAQFNGQVCRLDSKYFAIQPNPSINNLTHGSIALWAYYNPPTDPNFTFHTIWTFQKFLDTYINGDIGNGVLQSADTWNFGKDFLNGTVFNVRDDTGTNHSYPIAFPDDNITGSWHHYVVTWDGTNFRGYFDGVLIGTAPMSGVSKISLGQYLAVGALMHSDTQNDYTNNCAIQYTSDTAQYGYPANQQYVMPNAGFLEGKMSDIRIYNRAITGAEAAALAAGTVVNPPPATDTTAPTVSLTSPTGGTITGVVQLSANANDPTVANQPTSGIFSVQFLLDNINNIATLSTAPYSGNWDTTGVSNGVHTITAIARDVAGNQTTSSAVTVTVNNPVIGPDITAPSIPTALTATVISSSQINLTWNAATDPTIVNAITSGIAGYRLYRGGALIATLPGTSYSNTGLTASTLYSYTVSSYDNANNSSNQSSAVSATTQAPPVNPPASLSNGSPLTALPAGTTQTILSLSTNIAATCKYSTVANTAYASMTGTFTTTGNMTHSTTISGLTNGTTYTYYVRCSTSLAIVNAGDYIISFSVASPAVAGGGPGGGYNPPSSAGPGSGGSGGAVNNAPSPVGIFTPTVPQKPLPVVTTPAACVAGTSAIPASALSLTIGSRGPAVSNLQTFLVLNGYLTKDSITGYFGPLTQAALAKYQAAHPTTNCSASTLPTGKSRLSAGFQFPTTLKTFTTSANVKNLQIFLNDRGYTVSTSGAGSFGNETTYYGPATMKALGKFQAANGISPAVGNFGPLTLAKVNQLLAAGK